MEEYKKVTISFTKDQLEKMDEITSVFLLKREASAICRRSSVKTSSWFCHALKKT